MQCNGGGTALLQCNRGAGILLQCNGSGSLSCSLMGVGVLLQYNGGTLVVYVEGTLLRISIYGQCLRRLILHFK